DGYYGGTNEARKIDNTTYYDWNTTWNDITRKLQPNATIFSDIGPDVRWVGNEKGFAAETHWATFTPEALTGKTAVPGNVNTETSSVGTRNGKYWTPAECDVPLRPGWFYHPEQDGKEKDADYLVDLYFKSVGRGACLDLGLSPTPEGKLHENDVRILKEFNAELTSIFSKNLTEAATISAGNSRNGFPVKNLTDGDRYSYWATNDNTAATEIIVDFTKATSVNIIQLRENIKLGQRINRVNIAAWVNNKWQSVAEVESVGANRLIKLEKPIDSSKIKISLIAPVSITLSELSVY
ncbi:MAG: alpha-L-fucosidase, partial [Spirosomataceae bacterium]